jgi:pimeloyl-ACP methyl ester carboxylesterase
VAVQRLILRRIVVGVLVGGMVFAVAQPGLFRLTFVQPARDLAFFFRELEPFSAPGNLSTQNPEPTTSETLQSASHPGGKLDLTISFDVWEPSVLPAPIALLLHGSSPRGRMLGLNQMIAERLREEGWIVFTPDARGFGDSDYPVDISDPLQWRSHEDVLRLLEYAHQHPHGDGTVVAIGHSLGASHLVETLSYAPKVDAVVLIGPSSAREDDAATLWRRIRFSSDRRLGHAVTASVLRDRNDREDVIRQAESWARQHEQYPLLLMNGSREEGRATEVPRHAADILGHTATHVLVETSHHYCGVYQLPWLAQPIIVRDEVLDRCVLTLVGFLAEIVADHSDRLVSPSPVSDQTEGGSVVLGLALVSID